MAISNEQRRRARLLAFAGVGAVATLVGTASPAVAADGVTVRLDPTEVLLGVLPVENFGGDPDAMFDFDGDPTEAPAFVRVPVQYSGSITVDLPPQFDASSATAELVFDDNEDGTPEATYSSSFAPANPNRLVIAATADGVTVTLPADDPVAADAATLTIEPFTSTLDPAVFDVVDWVDYELGFGAAAPAAQTVEPLLDATAQVPCGLTSGDRCPLPTPATPGSTVTLALTQDSVLRELGINDLTGAQVTLAEMDDNGYDFGPDIEPAVEVNRSTATFVLPEDAAPGSYFLGVDQRTPSGGVSLVVATLTVEAPAAPAAGPASPEPNPGLRSNTGVLLPEAGAPDGSNGNAVVAGAGLLLMAGTGAAAVARNRRRPAVGSGPCEV